jgi:hypothetical protein
MPLTRSHPRCLSCGTCSRPESRPGAGHSDRGRAERRRAPDWIVRDREGQFPEPARRETAVIRPDWLIGSEAPDLRSHAIRAYHLVADNLEAAVGDVLRHIGRAGDGTGPRSQ